MQRDKEELVRIERLASIGQLAASVAHEINNPITGVINYAQMLLNKNDLPEEHIDLVERIQKEGIRVEKIVKSLLNYSRDTKSIKKDNNVKNIVYEALSILDQNFRRDSIMVKFEWAENLPLLICNFQQIEQVLINILRNAYQALAKNPPDDRLVVISGEVIDCCLRLTISNNGPSIPSEALKTILHPFVTTKSEGEGTGLGLSISEEIMKQHDGKLEIRSEPEDLTEMTLIFPLGEYHEGGSE